MATAPWWWVPLITVIGAPLLGALLYFFVPLLRVAKRLGIWLSASNPPWWVQNIFAALLVGGIVAAVSVLWQESISNKQGTQATRLENLRFVRQLSSEKDVVARPFAEFDLQGQNLAGLDLKGAHLDSAKLQHANFFHSDLSPRCVQESVDVRSCEYASLSYADLTGADLAVADLTGAILEPANLTGADLTGAVLERAHLTGADLTGAILDRAQLTGAHLEGADLPGYGATPGANLTGANLTGANLTGIYYDETTKWPVGFKPPPPATCQRIPNFGFASGGGGCSSEP